MLFLAATLLLLQDKAAEETFRRMTESVEKASSLKEGKDDKGLKTLT